MFLEMKSQRNLSFDVVRALACLMVVLMHSPMPGCDAGGLVLSSISLLCAPCIGLFFMVSGALLLPVEMTTATFLRRRMGKVVVPTLFWTFLYMAVNRPEGGMSVADFVRAVCSIPFSPQGHGVLWFMYVLVGLYLLAPVVSPWLQRASRREMQFFLSLWVVTLFYPLLQTVVTVSQGPTAPLYYFAGYAGYFVLGHYLHRFRPRIAPWLLALLLILPLSCAAACKLGRVQVDFYSVFWYLSVFVAMMCVAWFQGIGQYMHGLKLPVWLEKLLVDFSNCSFGIYLVHILIMRNVLWKSDFIQQTGGKTQIALIFLLTVVLSYAVVHAVSYMPGAGYLTGCGRRNKKQGSR